MRILLLTDNFVPETNSPALRAYEHAREWVADGADVTVITSIPNFPTGVPLAPYRNRPYQREWLNGIEVIRVWTFLAPNRGVFRRSLDFLSFAASGFFAGLFRTADVIVATSPQLLTGVAGWWLACIKHKPWILEVRDLWPASIVDVGLMQENLFIRLLSRLERRLYRHATRVVAVSAGIRDGLLACGVPSEKIGIVPNGVDLRRFGAERRSGVLPSDPALRNKVIAAYVGTHGMAQGLETVVDAADRLKTTNIHFLFVGDGARREAVTAHAKDLGLTNVTFTGLVPLTTAEEYLHLSEIVLIPLKRTKQIQITLPAKIFEAAALGKPMIVSAEGASADLVQRYGAGLVVPPESPDALAGAIAQLCKDSSLRARLAQGGLALARDFDRRRFAKDMLEQIRQAASQARRSTRA
jgi:glycosyltransferase involved in cell wall biosynthesis